MCLCLWNLFPFVYLDFFGFSFFLYMIVLCVRQYKQLLTIMVILFKWSYFFPSIPLMNYFGPSKILCDMSTIFWEIRKKYCTPLSLTFGYRTCPHDRNTSSVYDVLSDYFDLKSELDFTYLVPNAHHPHTAQRV
jgi:hypothetical protein